MPTYMQVINVADDAGLFNRATITDVAGNQINVMNASRQNYNRLMAGEIGRLLDMYNIDQLMAQNHDGSTLLHELMQSTSLDVGEHFLKQHIAMYLINRIVTAGQTNLLNIQDNNGYTALHWSALMNELGSDQPQDETFMFKKVYEKLVRNGADQTLTTNDPEQYTPNEFARVVIDSMQNAPAPKEQIQTNFGQDAMQRARDAIAPTIANQLKEQQKRDLTM